MFLMRSLILTILICSTHTYATSDFKKYWKLRRDTNVTKTWKLNGSKGVYASLTETKLQETKNIKTIIKKGKYLKEIEAKKRSFLKFFGASSWKRQTHKWKKIKGRDALEVSGTYLDSNNERVKFVELHYFKKNKIIQMLYVAPKGFKTKKDYYESFFEEHM